MIPFTGVKKAYGGFSNMSPHPIVFEGKTYPTSEHLFQVLRFVAGSPIREEIRLIKSPMAAKIHAKNHVSQMLVVPQSDTDLDNMRLCLQLKIDQHLEIRKMLLDSGTEEIVEDVSKRMRGSGPFWGKGLVDGVWTGQNMLGVLWMELREKIS